VEFGFDSSFAQLFLTLSETFSFLELPSGDMGGFSGTIAGGEDDRLSFFDKSVLAIIGADSFRPDSGLDFCSPSINVGSSVIDTFKSCGIVFFLSSSVVSTIKVRSDPLVCDDNGAVSTAVLGTGDNTGSVVMTSVNDVLHLSVDNITGTIIRALIL